MKMSIFVFTLAVALAAGSAYSEMIAMNDSPGATYGVSAAPINGSDDTRLPMKMDRGY